MSDKRKCEICGCDHFDFIIDAYVTVFLCAKCGAMTPKSHDEQEDKPDE